MKVSRSMIAKRAGVTPTTVSCALNGTRPVSDKVKARVMAAVEELNYVPDAAARTMSGKGSNQIAIVVDNFQNPFFAELVASMEAEGSEKGFFVSVCGRGDMAKYTSHIIAHSIDGVYFCSEIKESEAKYVESLLNSGIKVLTGPRFHCFQERISLIDMATGQAITDAVDYLHKNGHQKIAFISSFAYDSNQDDRLVCYEKRMREKGLKPQTFGPDETTIATIEHGKQMFDTIPIDEMPTAIIGINDLVAIGAMCRAQERGFSVPQDISFVGMDGIQLGELVSPKLTTFRSDADKLGKIAFQMLYDLIQGKNVQSYNHKMSLCERESVLKI